MDHRLPLRAHTVLAFDGMPCHIEEVVGCGSNAIVYKGWYDDRLCPEQRHYVLVKELFPFHPAGKIWRDEQGNIIVEPEAWEVWEAHRQSFLAGNRIHLGLLEAHPDLLGANLNSFSRGGTLYSVLGYAGGRDLAGELTRPGLRLRRIAQWMLGLLDALEAFHKSGYLHMDISPDNIMLVGQGDGCRIFLIDYNSARPVEAGDWDFLSVKDGYSAPEAETRDTGAIGFASDLYSVAAVFFRCLMGRRLTLEERLRPKAPGGGDSPLLDQAPQTVKSMVEQILRKGLNILPGKRYQTTGQMRLAFRELLDRIDCVGVTHWALWESGRRSVEELIRVNPSLRYLKDQDGLYPIRLERSGSLPLAEYLARLLSPEGTSGLILAQGGMGKTTLLLHTALLQGKRYSASAPAVIYLSLSGWRPADTQYITTQILLRLRFTRETNTFDSAMHALDQLLGQSRHTRNGQVPSVLLLLDGLNEIRGDPGPLIQEINRLSAMEGVRILAASRSEVPELTLAPAGLAPLEPEDVEAALGKRGLLVPRSPEVLPLLRTPLILSIYMQASEGGKQLDVHSQEELMKAYLDALYRKELAQLPENAPERWQLDAALQYVLPNIAAEEKRTGRGLTDPQLLNVVKRCWRAIRSRGMSRAFPQWIGHSRDILAGTETAEQWYGVVVHRLLWQRLGLLMRDASGEYRIFHQAVKEYLAGLAGPERERRRKRGILSGAIGVSLLLVLLFGAARGREKADEQLRRAIDYSAFGYASYGFQYEQLRRMTDDGLAGEDFSGTLDAAQKELAAQETRTDTEALYRIYLEEQLPGDGGTVSWSGLPFEKALALELVGYASERADYYAQQLPVLARWAASEQAQADCPQLLSAFADVLEADADVASELYHQTCAVHLEGGEQAWQQGIRDLVAEVPGLEAHRLLTPREDRKQYLENLRVRLRQAEMELARAKAFVPAESQSIPGDAEEGGNTG